jgi:hypothetical protein
MKVKRHVMLVCVFASLGWASASCKPQGTNSSVASLDNFARKGGSVRANICTGRYESLEFAPTAEVDVTFDKNSAEGKKVEAAFMLALSAAPDQYKAMLRWFPNTVIRITPKAAEICASRLSATDRLYAGEGEQVRACWDPEDQRFALYLDADASVIQHHLVRMYARAASEVMARLPEVMSAEHRAAATPFVESAAKFAAFRARLTDAFIKEVNARKKAGDALSLDRFGDLLASETGRRVFEHYVFAESFDSYYCNTEVGGTREMMIRDFPRTAAVFKDYARDLEADSGFLDVVRKTMPEDKSVGFALGHRSRPNSGADLPEFAQSGFYRAGDQAMTKAYAAGEARATYYQNLADGTNSSGRAHDTEIQRMRTGTSDADVYRQKQFEAYNSLGGVVHEGARATLSPLPNASIGADLAEGNVSSATGRYIGGRYVGDATSSSMLSPVYKRVGSSTGAAIGDAAQEYVMPGTSNMPAPTGVPQGAYVPDPAPVPASIPEPAPAPAPSPMPVDYSSQQNLPAERPSYDDYYPGPFLGQ